MTHLTNYNIIILMINRLVAQNTIKLAFRGQPYFSINKKLLSFQTDTHIKIKTLHKDTKDIDLPFPHPPLQFSLSLTQPWLLVLTPSHLLQIYLIEYNLINEGQFKKIAILHNVDAYKQNKWGLAVAATDKTLKTISHKQITERTEINLNIDCNTLKALSDLDTYYKIITDLTSDRILLLKSKTEQIESAKEIVTEINDRVNKAPKYQKYSTVTYLKEVLSLYKSKYVFQRKGQKQIEIIDIDESKLVGKFGLEGAIKHCQIKQNLMLIITNKQNTDSFHFFVLNPQPSSTQPLITNRVTYEKGKGDIYRLYNLPTFEAAQFLQKKKNVEVSDKEIQKIQQSTSSLLYILNKGKEKIQIIKLDHSKLLKSPFGEQKMDHIIYSKKSADLQTIPHNEQATEIERARVHSSIQLKVGEKSMEEMQKRFVQNLIDIKLKKVMLKFNQLQQRVANLQKVINGINLKIQQNLQKINRKEIKQKVQQLFDTLTPQFQKYFSEIFKQVSGVFEQGINYYNLKLAKEVEFHKQALTQIVTDTFKFTEEVAQISKKEQAVSEKTEEHLRKILESKKKWTKATEQFESRTREAPSPVVRMSGSASEAAKPEGKVFVRADLNFPSTKRQT